MLRIQDLPYRATIGEGQYAVWYQKYRSSPPNSTWDYFSVNINASGACVLVGSSHANSCLLTVCFGGIERLQGRTGTSYLNMSALVSNVEVRNAARMIRLAWMLPFTLLIIGSSLRCFRASEMAALACCNVYYAAWLSSLDKVVYGKDNGCLLCSWKSFAGCLDSEKLTTS
jgi:hypothetical protein